MQVQPYCSQTLWDCSQIEHRAVLHGYIMLGIQHCVYSIERVPSWSPLLIHFQDKRYLSLFLPELILSFLVVLVNGNNPRVRRWSRARVKLSLPWEGARKRKKSEVHRRRKGRTGEPWKSGSAAFGQTQTFLHSNKQLDSPMIWQWSGNHQCINIWYLESTSIMTEIKYIQIQDPEKGKWNIFSSIPKMKWKYKTTKDMDPTWV